MTLYIPIKCILSFFLGFCLGILLDSLVLSKYKGDGWDDNDGAF